MAKSKRQSPLKYVPRGTTTQPLIGIGIAENTRKGGAHHNRTDDVRRGSSRKTKHKSKEAV